MCLKVLAGGGDNNSVYWSRFQDYLLIARKMTEFFWWSYVPHLKHLRPVNKSWQGEAVTLVGDACIPPAIGNVLEKGPKFCTMPKFHNSHMLSTVHDIADKAPEADRSRCI